MRPGLPFFFLGEAAPSAQSAPIHASLQMELKPFILGLVDRIQEVCGLEWGKKITSLLSQTTIVSATLSPALS